MSSQSQYTAFFDTGFPLCPNCLEDRLFCTTPHDAFDGCKSRAEEIQVQIKSGLRCGKCGWESEEYKRRNSVVIRRLTVDMHPIGFRFIWTGVPYLETLEDVQRLIDARSPGWNDTNDLNHSDCVVDLCVDKQDGGGWVLERIIKDKVTQ